MSAHRRFCLFLLVVLAIAMSGAIYLRAAQETKLTASDGAARNLFGSAVAIYGDTAIVGAPEELILVPGPSCDDRIQAHFAAAHIFVRSSGVWTRQARLEVTGIYTQFGSSVALSGDTAVVGAPGVPAFLCNPERTGAAYVYVRSGTTWTQQASFFAPGGVARFGRSVAIAGDTLVIGGPSASYVYTRSGTTWTLHTTLSIAATSVAIDATTIVASAGSSTR